MAFTLSGDVATTRTNLGLGDAATKTVGTGASNIPLNSNLGDAATKTVGTSAGNIPILDSSGKIPSSTVDALPSGGTVGQVVTNTAAGTGNWQTPAAGGKILQVIQTPITSTMSVAGDPTSNSWTDIPGFSAIITPSSASSRIMVMATISYTAPSGDHAYFNITRSGVSVSLGDSSQSRTRVHVADRTDQNSRMQTIQMTYVDSPATTAERTYRIQATSNNTNSALWFNRTGNDANAFYRPRATSTLIVMEIGA